MPLQEVLLNLQNLGGLQMVYTVSLILGIVLPALSLLLGGLADGLDFDFDLDLDGLPVGVLLPLKPMCLLLFLLIFGGLGLLLYGRISMEGSLVIASTGGYAAAILLNLFVLRPLKASGEQAAAVKAADLIGCLGRVSARIRPGAMGAVQISTSQGIVSYVAQLEAGAERLLDEGELAEIVAVNEQGTLLTVRLFPDEELAEL